ncbi:MAG: hypothetical protein WDZ59_00620 [Pirellulales bacterium]
MASNLPVVQHTELVSQPTTVDRFLLQIRPQWRAKSLIERVQRLLPVDPSSACQRLLNASLHDLREKIVLAGLDIAKQAAQLHSLPTIAKAEDIENLSNNRVLDLSYRMGLLTRAEWRRLKRCYEIRRDLEHEDDEYEAQLEDCVYIFKTCIEVVLSRDPVELLKVTNVKDVVEQAVPQFPEEAFLEDYRNAPDPRQQEIMLFLVSAALDPARPDVVRCNAVEMMKHLQEGTKNPVKIEIATQLQQRVGRAIVDVPVMKVAHAAGVAPYLKRTSRTGYFADLLRRLNEIGYQWRKYERHADILAEFEDVGGLQHCDNDDVAIDVIRWLVLCYIGEPGGMTRYGHRREIFNSDAAAPIIERIVKRFSERDLGRLKSVAMGRAVKGALAAKKGIAQRYEDLIDIAGDV